jgi:hypothetical protein
MTHESFARAVVQKHKGRNDFSAIRKKRKIKLAPDKKIDIIR